MSYWKNPSFSGKAWLCAGIVLLSTTTILAWTDGKTFSPWKGKALFEEKGCIRCHSIYGEGGKGGPDLGKRQFFGTYLELAAHMWNHFPRMVRRMRKEKIEFPRLNGEEIGHVISYLSFIRYLGEPGNERHGRRLLRSKKCLKCHAVDGKGGDIGPDFRRIESFISPLKLAQLMWNHGPKMMELFEKYNIQRPEISGREIVDLAAGLRSLMSVRRIPKNAFDLGDPAEGKKILERKGCMECHSFKGKGGKLGPDFAELAMDYTVTQIAGKMWNHGPKMWNLMKKKDIPFPVFSEREMADLLAYIYSLRLVDRPGDPEAGKQLVEKRGCLRCHQLFGRGKEIGPDLAKLKDLKGPHDMIAAMWNHAPGMVKKAREKKYKWPEFSGRDMANLFAYLQSLTTKP